jgi:hypothetical protein
MSSNGEIILLNYTELFYIIKTDMLNVGLNKSGVIWTITL